MTVTLPHEYSKCFICKESGWVGSDCPEWGLMEECPDFKRVQSMRRRKPHVLFAHSQSLADALQKVQSGVDEANVRTQLNDELTQLWDSLQKFENKLICLDLNTELLENKDG